MADLESVLKSQETNVARDREIDRILNVDPRDYFAILQINPLVGEESLAQNVKRNFRKKSLQIHPDKAQHPDAPKAFDALKRAELVLSSEVSEDADPKAKERTTDKTNLIDIYKQVFEGLKLPLEDDFDHKSNAEIRGKVQLVLENQTKQAEIERVYNQRQEASKNEEMQNALKDRKLRKQWETKWENDRDARVELWRTYVKKVDKKKKTKKKVLA